MDVLRGATPGRWTFRFSNSPLSEALRMLGRHGGWTVVVAPEVEGRITAEFVNADPDEVLGLMIKTYRCTIDRRSGCLIVHNRTEVQR